MEGTRQTPPRRFIVTVLDELDEDALCEILTEPKNSIIRQYQATMKLDNVEL